MPKPAPRRFRFSIALWVNLPSVGWAIALGWTVVSTAIRSDTEYGIYRD